MINAYPIIFIDVRGILTLYGYFYTSQLPQGFGGCSCCPTCVAFAGIYCTVHTFLSYIKLREVSSYIVYVTYLLSIFASSSALAFGSRWIRDSQRPPQALFSHFGRSLDGFEPQCCRDFVSPVAQAELGEEPPQDVLLSCIWSSYSSAWLRSNDPHVGEFWRLTGDHVTHVFELGTLKSIGFLWRFTVCICIHEKPTLREVQQGAFQVRLWELM